MNESLHWADNHVHVDRYIFETAPKDLIDKMNDHLEGCTSCQTKVKHVLLMYLAIREYSREDIKHFITINDYIEQKKAAKKEKKIGKNVNFKQIGIITGIITFLAAAFFLLQNMSIEPVAIVTDGSDGYVDGTISKTKTNDPVTSTKTKNKTATDTVQKSDLENRSYIRVAQYKKGVNIKVVFDGLKLKKTSIFPYSFKVKYQDDPISGKISKIILNKHKLSFGNLTPEAKVLLTDQIEIIFTNKIRYRNSIAVPTVFIRQ